MCVACTRQFIKPVQPRRYSDDIKWLYLRMYVNGMGIREIARVRGTTNLTPDQLDKTHWGTLI